MATQRFTYLDTIILGQLHTYFINKLLRKNDRNRIKETFSLSDEELVETFKFVKGNWLLVSHEGLGLENIPLSIKTEDANERIIKFLKNILRRIAFLKIKNQYRYYDLYNILINDISGFIFLVQIFSII
ncbi:MAG: hypothetical protein ACTSRZ_02715 [Promethearchaeota archaeon]